MENASSNRPRGRAVVCRMFEGRPANIPAPDRRGLAAAWWRALRPPFLIVDFIPVALGLALAVRTPDNAVLPFAAWPWGRTLLVLAGCFLVHTIANIANDLFDYILGVDTKDSIGGTGVIQSGAIPPRSITFAIIVFLAMASAIAWVLLDMSGQWWLTGVLAFSVFSAIFYVAPPIRYGHRGYGELFVALNMGFIMTSGTQIVLTGHFEPAGLAFGLPVGIMVAGILFFQSLPEIETDKAAGKYTLAVKLGKERSRMLFDIWWPAVWVLMLNLWAVGLVSGWIALGLLTAPLASIVSRRLHRASTSAEWLNLDASGHLVRKLYLLNGAAMIAGAFFL